MQKAPPESQQLDRRKAPFTSREVRLAAWQNGFCMLSQLSIVNQTWSNVDYIYESVAGSYSPLAPRVYAPATQKHHALVRLLWGPDAP